MSQEASVIEQIQKDLKELKAIVEELSRQQSASGQSVQVSATEPARLSLNIQAEVDLHSGDGGGGWRRVSTSAGTGGDEQLTVGAGGDEGLSLGPGPGGDTGSTRGPGGP